MSERSKCARVIVELSLELEVMSALHVGSGDLAIGADNNNDDLPRTILKIWRDRQKKPHIPGTTFKGLLRRLGEEVDAGRSVNNLFGEIRNNQPDGEVTGRAGAVTVFGGSLSYAVPTGMMPFGEMDGLSLGEGVFLAARTRIDGASGTASDNKLFFQEMVAPGCRFRLDLEVDRRAKVLITSTSQGRKLTDIDGLHAACSPRDAHDDCRLALEQLKPILAKLTSTGGQQIGKGQADGAGAVRLIGITIKGRRLMHAGTLDGFDLKAAGFPDLSIAALRSAFNNVNMKPDQIEFRLQCDGPFLVADSSRRRRRDTGDGESRKPHIQPQRFSEHDPMVLGFGISGALAARAEWLAQVQLRIPPRNGARVWTSSPNGVTTLDLLLGMSGFRGLLQLQGVRLSRARTWDIASVKLDRFTGGTVDNALFTTRAYKGATLDFSLSLNRRRMAAVMKKFADPQHMTDQLQAVYDALCQSIAQEGLQIGQGGNHGFGWFEPVSSTGNGRSIPA